MFGIEGLDCDELLLIAFVAFGIIAIGFLFLWRTNKPLMGFRLEEYPSHILCRTNPLRG